MERLQAVGPQRAVTSLEVGAAAVVFVEVEEEVDLDVAALARELGETDGECVGVEGRRSGRRHDDLRCVFLGSTGSSACSATRQATLWRAFARPAFSRSMD